MTSVADVVDAHETAWIVQVLAGPVADRVELASSADLPAAAAARLRRDRSVKVRRALAQNAACPTEVLEGLAGRDDAVAAVAELKLHKRAPVEKRCSVAELETHVTERLPVGRVIDERVLRDPRLPAGVRAAVIAGGLRWDQLRLLENPALTWEEARLILAAHAALPVWSGHPPSAQSAAYHYAANPNAAGCWLAATVEYELTSARPNTEITARVARNPRTPLPALRRLLDAGQFPEYVLAHPSATAELVVAYAERHLRKLEDTDDWWARAGVERAATHPRAPRELLAHLGVGRVDRPRLFRLLRTHCTTPAQAAVALQLTEGFAGTVAELLDLAAAVSG